MCGPLFPEGTNPYGVGGRAQLTTGEWGTVLPLLGDAHVHLGLFDGSELRSGGIGRVLDLGWSTPELRNIVAELPGLDIEWAGNFLAAEGGYPSDRSWAPPRATLFVEDVSEAISAQVSAGASAIKITLNSDAGPVHSDEVLHSLITEALRAGLLPIIHAEGAGQAVRAITAGPAVTLAHTPFTELLSDDLISYAAKNNYGWMSTLDIHGYGEVTEAFSIASTNLSKFIEAGGTVFYGTDLGNGPLPEGINVRELRALSRCGLGREELLDSMTEWWDRRRPVPNGGVVEEPRSFISEISDNSCEDFASWLATARIVEHNTLEFL